MPSVIPFKPNPTTKPLAGAVEIDGSCTVSDAALVLQGMRFKQNELLPVLIDASFRDYLIHTALKRR